MDLAETAFIILSISVKNLTAAARVAAPAAAVTPAATARTQVTDAVLDLLIG